MNTTAVPVSDAFVSDAPVSAAPASTRSGRYHVDPIAPHVIAELLQHDDSGQAPQVQVDDEGGAPLRCCLRYSQPGERVALVAYEPLSRWARAARVDPGPYDERGPVFVHAADCPGFDGNVHFGPRRRVLRRYGGDGRILGGRLVDANEDHEAVLAELFDDGTTAMVHVRAVEYGCFLYSVHPDRV